MLIRKFLSVLSVKGEPQVGIVNGLAWTSVGGDVLTIEAIKIKGQGNMVLTGSLGDVMKESAKICPKCSSQHSNRMRNG